MSENSLRRIGCGVLASLVVANCALLIAAGACVLAWQLAPSFHYMQAFPGDSYLMFRDEKGELFGTITRTYGNELMIRRIERPENRTDDGSRETQILLGKEQVTISFWRDGGPVAKWSLSADSDGFEKMPTETGQ
jgi:hypothetical protein